MPLLRFVVEFVRVLREQVAEREPVERVVDKQVEQVVGKQVEQVVDRQVAVQVAEHIARVLPWVEPLSWRREPH